MSRIPAELKAIEGRSSFGKVVNALNALVKIDNKGAAASGCTAEEFGDDYQHVTKITVADFTQAVTAAALAFGKKIYDFPLGHIKVDRALIELTVTAPASTTTGEVALGTVVASGAAATTGGTATFEDIIDGTATTESSSTGAVTLVNKACEADVPDGHSTALDLYLNLAGTWEAAENLTISAEVTIFWKYLGA